MDEALAFVQEMGAPVHPVIGLYTAASKARAFYGGIDAVAKTMASDSGPDFAGGCVRTRP